MGADTPGPPDDGDRPGRRSGWDNSAGLAVALERDQPFGSRTAHRTEISGRRPADAAERAQIVREIITDDAGNYIGKQGRRKDVHVVTPDELKAARDALHARLGTPDQVGKTERGSFESWWISTAEPRSTVTYRNFSNSRGNTIDLNKIAGIEDLNRIHIPDNEQRMT